MFADFDGLFLFESMLRTIIFIKPSFQNIPRMVHKSSYLQMVVRPSSRMVLKTQMCFIVAHS